MNLTAIYPRLHWSTIMDNIDANSPSQPKGPSATYIPDAGDPFDSLNIDNSDVFDTDETMLKTVYDGHGNFDLYPLQRSATNEMSRLSPPMNDHGDVQCGQRPPLSDVDTQFGQCPPLSNYGHVQCEQIPPLSNNGDVQSGQSPPLNDHGDEQCGQSPPLNDNGDVQCGQPTNDLIDTSATDPPPSYSFDYFDTELNGLPKTSYLNKLIELSNASEEIISQYRIELSKRAKLRHNAPSGELKDRRNTTRTTIAEKYASDCFTIYQFLSSNITDIDDLYRRSSIMPPFSSSSQSTPAKNVPRAHDLKLTINDVSVLKGAVASLKADVHVLKRESDASKQKIEDMGLVLRTEISEIKHELKTCSDVISNHKQFFTSQQDGIQLSDSIKAICTHISKLDNAKNALNKEVSDLKVSVKHNSGNISNLYDEKTTRKNSLKLQMSELRNQLTDDISKVASSTAQIPEHETNIKTIQTKLKEIEHKTNSNNVNQFEKSFDKFSKELGAKFDRLCSAMETTLQKVTSKPLPPDNQQPPVTLNSAPTNIERANHQVTPRPQRKGEDEFEMLKAYPLPPNDNNYESDHAPTYNTAHSYDREQSQQNDQKTSYFTGVLRKKAKAYLITGIDPNSTEEGLKDFLESNDITYKSVKFLFTKRTDCKVAQIVVNEDQSAILENPEAWPRGISCRPWMKYADYKSRHERPAEYFTPTNYYGN